MADAPSHRLVLTDPAYLARLGQLSEVEVRAASFKWATDLVRRGVSGVDAAAELAELRKPPFGDMARDEQMAVYGQPTSREEAWMLNNNRMDLLNPDARVEFLLQRLHRIAELERELRGDRAPASAVSTLADALFDQVQGERPPTDASTATEVAFRFSPEQLAVAQRDPGRFELWVAALKVQQQAEQAQPGAARAWWTQDPASLAATLSAQATSQMPQTQSPAVRGSDLTVG